MAENPSRALKGIAKSSDTLSFAMFASQDIVADATARYGTLCLLYPYLVPTICTAHEINDLPGNYFGFGEVGHEPPLYLRRR